MADMTRYERCIAALRGEPADRAPVLGGWICQQEFLARMSGVTVEEFWKDPHRLAVEAYLRAGADAIVQFVLPKRPDQSTVGSGGRPTNFGRYAEPLGAQFPTQESVIDYVRDHSRPDEVAARFDRQAWYDFYVKLFRDGDERMAPMVWIPGHVCGCPAFQQWYTHFGYENFLTALHDAAELFERFFATLGEEVRLRSIEAARATRDHGLLPVVYCGEDICYGSGPICSPRLLEQVYFPHLRRAFEPLKDAGMQIIWHSDGYIMPIIHQLIDAGADGFQGLEEDHGMHLAEVAAMTNRDGVPLVIWGSVSVTSTLPHGTVEDVRADVRRCLDLAARRGGHLFLAPSSSVGPEVPTENIIEFHRYGVEYGLEAWRAGGIALGPSSAKAATERPYPAA